MSIYLTLLFFLNYGQILPLKWLIIVSSQPENLKNLMLYLQEFSVKHLQIRTWIFLMGGKKNQEKKKTFPKS